MSEHTFGPHHPSWTKEHQEASEPTDRELGLLGKIDALRETLDRSVLLLSISHRMNDTDEHRAEVDKFLDEYAARG